MTPQENVSLTYLYTLQTQAFAVCTNKLFIHAENTASNLIFTSIKQHYMGSTKLIRSDNSATQERCLADKVK